VYSIQSATTYSARLAANVKIISGGVICPPAGSVCTAAQLITAASSGFFAEAALDPYGTLVSIIERDNA
jgi:hypothetical protein